MSVNDIIMSAAGGSSATPYVDDVFGTYIWTAPNINKVPSPSDLTDKIVSYTILPDVNTTTPIAHPRPGYAGPIDIILAGRSSAVNAYWSPDAQGGTDGSGQVARWTYTCLGDETSFSITQTNKDSNAGMMALNIIGGVNNGKTLCVGSAREGNSYGASAAANDFVSSSTLTTATLQFSGACRPYNATISYSDATSYTPAAPASYGNTASDFVVDSNLTIRLNGSTSPGGIWFNKNNTDSSFGTAIKTSPPGNNSAINLGVAVLIFPAKTTGNKSLVWAKCRNNSVNNQLFTSVKNGVLVSDGTAAIANSPYFIDANGLTLFNGNAQTNNMVAWSWKAAPNFLDIVTYTGNAIAGRAISHTLGSVPGMIIVKRTDVAGGYWSVYHRGTASGTEMFLQTTNALSSSAYFGNGSIGIAPTSTTFTIAGNTDINASGGSYIAYLFAHDTSGNGIIQCGTFSGASGTVVNLGWEPQWVLWKNSTNINSWGIADITRGMAKTPQATAYLLANAASQEAAASGNIIDINATGFIANLGAPGDTYIYMAVRRSNKPPTSGTQVYNAIARTGNGIATSITGVGFAPDLSLSKSRNNASGETWYDKLRGKNYIMWSYVTSAENTSTSDGLTSFDMDGVSVGADASGAWINTNTWTFINHYFKRSQNVFDILCWTQTVPGAPFQCQTINHSLGVTPELVIHKSRSGAGDNWYVTGSILGTGNRLLLNGTYAIAANGASGNAAYTSTTVTLPCEQGSGATYVAYLFASKAGISKIGSYTGNGTTQTINCGFTTGARFIMIKRTDSTGDWYVWDTVRGIIAANDPHISLNTSVAEITTDDSIDPDTSGFIVNQLSATNINVSAGTYIYLAFA